MKKTPEAYFEDSIFEDGIGDVIVCRYKSGGWVEAGVFLVNVWCLGVKDAFFEACTEEEFQHILTKFFPDGVPQPKPACEGRKLVEGALHYAKTLGFSPHPDYKKGARVFGGINASDCPSDFIFGRDGRPLYIQGPHDDKEKAERIISTLTNKLGQKGFDFILHEDGDLFDSETDDSEDEIQIIAMDSMAEDGQPDSVLVDFAESYCDELRADGCSVVIKYPGKANAPLAKKIRESVRDMAKEFSANSTKDVSLADCLLFTQNLMKIRGLAPEEREVFCEALPEEKREYIREMVADFQDLDEMPFFIHEFKILDAENIGRERLLMLVELE